MTPAHVAVLVGHWDASPMPGRGTGRRTIRVPEDLWQAALSKAEERGEILSDEIRKFLERYVQRKPKRPRRH